MSRIIQQSRAGKRASELTGLDAICAQYPFLQQEWNDRAIVHVNSAATSQIPLIVDARVTQAAGLGYENVHRGHSRLSQNASHSYELAHKTVEQLLNAEEGSVFFTGNTTLGLNTVLHSVAEYQKAHGMWDDGHGGEGGALVTTESEHSSSVVPMQQLAEKFGLRMVYLSTGKWTGTLYEVRPSDIPNDTRILAVTHASNVTGAITPVAVIGRMLRNKCPNAFYLVDGAQTAPRLPINVQELDALDAFVGAGHKITGPATSFVYMKPEWIQELTPPFLGGGTVTDVTHDGATLVQGIEKWEPGTPNILGAVALDAGIRFNVLCGIGHLEKSPERRDTLLRSLESQELQALAGLPEPELARGLHTYLFGDDEPPAEKMAAYYTTLAEGRPLDLDRFELTHGQDLPQPLVERAMENIFIHELELYNLLMSEILDVENVGLVGEAYESPHVGVISVIPKHGSVEKLARRLDERAIETREGCHCAHILIRKLCHLLGQEGDSGNRRQGTVRFSLDKYNTREDMIAIGEALREIREEDEQ
ncbi:MAG: aminotransferase class V-fold PLP-dependent enzyme [Methanobacteriota archaeon]